ncbi:MAG: PHA/PHB synthase family protein [Burkholderiaceae bacterium]
MSATPSSTADFFSQLPTLIDPEQFLQWQRDYLQHIMSGPKPDTVAADRRFGDANWQSNAVFAQMAGWYGLHAQHIEQLKSLVHLPKHEREQFAFALDQWLAALSPSNYLLTNPEALALAQATGGESISKGIANLLSDMQKGKISQADDSVFTVGKNVATTPGDVVFENEFIQLIQYKPLTPTVAKRPFLIVPPCINKFYILDLQPENSLVRYAVEQGNTVFLVSWRNPLHGQMDNATWDDYLWHGPIAAMVAVAKITGEPQMNTLGFCVGGTLLASALSVLRAKQPKGAVFPAASLTLLTTLLDFSDPGILGVFIDEAQVAMRESALAGGGLMSGKELANVFSALRPNDLVWNYVVSNYLKGETPPAFDLLYWNGDSTNLPGPMYCWYLRNLYLNNALVSGKLPSLGVKMDLTSIDVPTFVYGSREDHIVPWNAAFESAKALHAKDIRFVLGASGHIAGVINPASKNKRSYWTGGKLAGSSTDWVAHAQEHPGSWWTLWSKWLAAHAGGTRPAPTRAGSAAFKPIEPAPGRYVQVKVA